MPQRLDEAVFEIDHVVAKKHGGRTLASNLALTCFFCNSCKGSNIAGLDPKTGKLTTLYHPRRHKWSRHFRWSAATLLGRTPIGRATIAVLNANDPFRIALRAALLEDDYSRLEAEPRGQCSSETAGGRAPSIG